MKKGVLLQEGRSVGVVVLSCVPVGAVGGVSRTLRRLFFRGSL